MGNHVAHWHLVPDVLCPLQVHHHGILNGLRWDAKLNIANGSPHHHTTTLQLDHALSQAIKTNDLVFLVAVQHGGVGLLFLIVCDHGSGSTLFEESCSPPGVSSKSHDMSLAVILLLLLHLFLGHLLQTSRGELARHVPFSVRRSIFVCIVSHHFAKLCVLGVEVPPDATKDRETCPFSELDLLVLLLHLDLLLLLFLELVHPLAHQVLQGRSGLLYLFGNAVIPTLLGSYEQVCFHLLILVTLDLDPTSSLQNEVLLE